jgi:cAMP-dependent protein kinase regulator
MKMIIAAMARSEHQPKETIIEKGAMTSQYFVLEDGKCEIETSDGDVFLLATGSAFGESSLLQPSNSTRSITARSRCLLWRLDRSVYLGIVVRTTAQRKRKFEKLLSKVQLLQAISPTERSMIADCLQAHFARAKSVIIAQGEKGDYFYIIMKGTVVVLDRHGMELSKLGEGQYFGEAALLSDAPRGATIQAVTDCELARIDKKTFVRLLGTLKVRACGQPPRTGGYWVAVPRGPHPRRPNRQTTPAARPAPAPPPSPAVPAAAVCPQAHTHPAYECVMTSADCLGRT